MKMKMKMKNKKTQQWLPVLHVFASFFLFLLTTSAQALEDTADSVADSIRIDCGAREDSTDPKTKSSYKADNDIFIEFGEAHNVSSKNYNKEQIGNQLKTLRSFPKGKRNCYTVPTPTKNTFYLVRAFFNYGNYDNKRTILSFDLYIGVNYWATINKEDGDIVRFEVIHVSPTDDGIINVCLENTGHGTPFISLLEVLPWQNNRYDQTASSLLRLMSRSKLGMSEDDPTYIRYPDDMYGRSWLNRKMENTVRISTSMAIDSDTSENTYKLPKEVLTSAVESVNVSLSSSLDINTDSYCHITSCDYYVYLHFYDFVNKASQNQQMRKMVISFSDGVNVTFTLEPFKPTTLVRNIKGGYLSDISIRSTSDSQLPAMLNAYEIFRVFPQPLNSTTDEGDVAAIREIKREYGIKNVNWQGDPCWPVNYTWEGLTCNNHVPPRVTSINLSFSNLSGKISPSFSSFTELEVLDLSYNNLTGEIPESLAVPKKLNHVNLTGNNIKCPIPKGLEDKINDCNLNSSTDGNKGKEIAIITGATGGAAAISGVALTLKFRLGFNMFSRNRGNESRSEKKEDERKSGKKEDERKDETKETNVSVKPKINNEAIEQQIPGF